MERRKASLIKVFFAWALVLSIVIAPSTQSQNPVVEDKGTPDGWSNEINLSNDPAYRDLLVKMAVNESNIHIVWLNDYKNVIYSKSINGGVNWSAPLSLYNATSNIQWPVIGVNNNTVHISWSRAYNIYYQNSTNNGNNWNPEKVISNQTGSYAIGPRMFLDDDNIHIAWLNENELEVYYRRSLDGGVTFDNGQGVGEDRRLTFSPSVVGLPLIAGYQNNLSVTWMDERNGDFEIYWMISKNNGNTWEDGLGHIGLDRRLTFTGVTDYALEVYGSNIYIVWNKYVFPGPTYTMYYCNSSDNGLSWSSAQILSGPSPGMGQPNINVEGNQISVVWQDRRDDGTHEQIYLKNSTDGGITWNSDLRLTYNLSRKSQTPQIIVINNTTHLVWSDMFPDNDREIMYKRSPDFPETTPPSHSNETPLPDSFKNAPGTNISVCVTDSSGVNASTIQLWVNGSLVPHNLTPITGGYNVSWASGGFGSGIVTCRIIANDNLGNRLDYTWNFTVLAIYTIPLQEGWNLISLPLEQVDTSVANVLSSISGQWDVVKYYNCMDKADPWKTYRVGSSMNDLAGIDNTMGFWIYINQPNVNLTVRGSIPTSTNIPLYAGWNLVGYPAQTTDTVANVLWGTGADRVEVFDPASPYIKEAEPTYIMKPGEGYWIHVPADIVWTVNW